MDLELLHVRRVPARARLQDERGQLPQTRAGEDS